MCKKRGVRKMKVFKYVVARAIDRKDVSRVKGGQKPPKRNAQRGET